MNVFYLSINLRPVGRSKFSGVLPASPEVEVCIQGGCGWEASSHLHLELREQQ